jgi:hypothetical protein
MSEAKPTSQYLRKKVAQINMTNSKPTTTTNGGHQTLNQVIRELENMQIPMVIRQSTQVWASNSLGYTNVHQDVKETSRRRRLDQDSESPRKD